MVSYPVRAPAMRGEPKAAPVTGAAVAGWRVGLTPMGRQRWDTSLGDLPGAPGGASGHVGRASWGVPITVSFHQVQAWVLPTDLSAASQARDHVARACAGLPEETVYTARLLVTELVSNAVIHGRGKVLLTVARDGAGVRVEVHDESPRPPLVVHRSPMAEHGAGLRLVSALAGSWGTEPLTDGQPGKRVWFTLP